MGVISTLHRVVCDAPSLVPFVAIYLSYGPITIEKGLVLGFLTSQEIDISEVSMETAQMSKSEDIDVGYDTERSETVEMTLSDKIKKSSFIVTPADIEMHRKVALKSAEVNDEHLEAFNQLCDKYKDVFSTDSSNIGKTPLIKMDIDTGDSPPMCQKPYNLPLKHAEWVKQELNILEKAGVIVESVSPWASPIVIVPKRSAPGEPPKRRLCVDYHVLNNLLTPVKKAHSKAKRVLTFVPLLKIDEIYARLQGSTVYSTLDIRSGYYNMEAFVSPLGKWEFKRCPFDLAEAPAYFQRLINEVLAPFDLHLAT